MKTFKPLVFDDVSEVLAPVLGVIHIPRNIFESIYQRTNEPDEVAGTLEGRLVADDVAEQFHYHVHNATYRQGTGSTTNHIMNIAISPESEQQYFHTHTHETLKESGQIYGRCFSMIDIEAMRKVAEEDKSDGIALDLLVTPDDALGLLVLHDHETGQTELYYAQVEVEDQ